MWKIRKTKGRVSYFKNLERGLFIISNGKWMPVLLNTQVLYLYVDIMRNNILH